jgi:hypothetical protein
MQDERHDFLEDNWRGWRRNWGGYYGGLALATGIVIGAAIASIPKQHTVVVVEKRTYYYSGGVYYIPSGTNYVVVPPPIGAIVVTLPPNSTIVGTDYWNANGAFYIRVSNGYQAVKPPVGVVVYELPNGATEVIVKGKKYFMFGGAFYKPYYGGDVVIYMIVGDPTKG